MIPTTTTKREENGSSFHPSKENKKRTKIEKERVKSKENRETTSEKSEI